MFDWEPMSPLMAPNSQMREFSGNGVHLKDRSKENVQIHCQIRPKAIIQYEVIEGFDITLPQQHKATDVIAPVFCLSPNEWLIVSPRQYDVSLLQKGFTEAVNSGAVAVTDLSDRLVVIELSGEAAMTLLSEGCGIDLHGGYFNAGEYHHTRLSDMSVLIHMVSDKPVYNLYIDRSLAFYLWQWLENGAACIAQK